MKFVILIILFLSGCSTTNNYAIYADTKKSISKDTTMSEISCYNTITETMRFGDGAVKTAAIKLIPQCKKPPTVVELPK